MYTLSVVCFGTISDVEIIKHTGANNISLQELLPFDIWHQTPNWKQSTSTF